MGHKKNKKIDKRISAIRDHESVNTNKLLIASWHD